MEDKKLQIGAITEKLDIEDVEVQQNDPCKDNIWNGVYNCLGDCAGNTPKATIWH